MKRLRSAGVYVSASRAPRRVVTEGVIPDRRGCKRKTVTYVSGVLVRTILRESFLAVLRAGAFRFVPVAALPKVKLKAQTHELTRGIR